MRFWITWVFAMITSIASAQFQFETPKIAFSPWQLIAEDTESTEYLASFLSGYRSGYVENDTVQLRLLFPADPVKPPPVVLILHYWGATNLRVERALARELNDRGMAAAILTLPYHLSRAPAGSNSGALAIQPDPEKLKATLSQAVIDVRRSIDYVQSRPECGPMLGIYGTSLGAIVSSLAYAVEPRLQNAVFLLGGIDLAHILWNSSITVPVRDELRRKGFSEDSLRAALVDIEPLGKLEPKPLGKTLVIQANFDTVIPARSTDLLVQSLPSSKLLKIDTGHYGGVLVQGRLLREAAEFFASINVGRAYNPPEKILSPTVRAGIMLRATESFDVAIGFDLLKIDRTKGVYMSLLLTPHDPVLWIGSDISRGTNLGVGLSTKRTTFGLFWSTVL